MRRPLRLSGAIAFRAYARSGGTATAMAEGASAVAVTAKFVAGFAGLLFSLLVVRLEHFPPLRR